VLGRITTAWAKPARAAGWLMILCVAGCGAERDSLQLNAFGPSTGSSGVVKFARSSQAPLRLEVSLSGLRPLAVYHLALNGYDGDQRTATDLQPLPGRTGIHQSSSGETTWFWDFHVLRSDNAGGFSGDLDLPAPAGQYRVKFLVKDQDAGYAVVLQGLEMRFELEPAAHRAWMFAVAALVAVAVSGLVLWMRRRPGPIQAPVHPMPATAAPSAIEPATRRLPPLSPLLSQAADRCRTHAPVDRPESDDGGAGSSGAPRASVVNESGMITASRAMTRVRDTLARFADKDLPVLITGESGVGKELAARTVHRLSARRSGPYVAINAAAIPETLLESELFGAKAGAYTGITKARQGAFARAHNGTLFLDEVGNASFDLQAKLLRVVQEKRFTPIGAEAEEASDFRLVAATNRDLRELVRENRFREDLYYRLCVLPVTIPPLRERREDIAAIVDQWVARHSDYRLDAEAIALLDAYPWPGNVRQLLSVLDSLEGTNPSGRLGSPNVRQAIAATDVGRGQQFVGQVEAAAMTPAQVVDCACREFGLMEFYQEATRIAAEVVPILGAGLAAGPESPRRSLDEIRHRLGFASDPWVKEACEPESGDWNVRFLTVCLSEILRVRTGKSPRAIERSCDAFWACVAGVSGRSVELWRDAELRDYPLLDYAGALLALAPAAETLRTRN
jgi:hypothetical protein